MPPRSFTTTRRQLRGAVRWAVLAGLVSVPLLFVSRLLVPGGTGPAVWLPGVGRSVVGIVQAVTPGGQPTAAKPSRRARPATVPSSPQRHAGAAATAASPPRGPYTLIPVVTQACTSCRVLRNASTGGIRVTLGSGQRTAAGSAFALLDFGGLEGAGGVVHVHDRIALARGQVPQSDISVLQVTDVKNRVAYRLQIDRFTRVLRIVSPPGGLGGSAIDESTGTQVPADGVRTLAVDIAAQAGRSLVVRVDGRTVVSRRGMSGGSALRQRFVAVGILNTPASMTTLSVTHDALQVSMDSTPSSDQSGVSASDLTLAPSVSLVPPANLAPPAITGDAVAGQPFTASAGTWSDANGVRIRWSRCDGDGSNCQQIPNASGSSYTPDSSDAGSTFLISVTASNDAGTAVAASRISPLVSDSKAVLVTAPSIAGAPTEGTTLTASPGTWTWRTGSFSYAWQRCDASGANCAAIPGATSSTFGLGHDDIGSTIRVLVTAPGLTAPTTAASPVTDAVQLSPPINLSAPTVSGAAVTGAVLTATAGDWAESSAPYGYTWDRCSAAGVCVPITGAGGNTYRLGMEDLGSALRVTVTAANAAGASSASSSPSGAVALGAPAISAGTAISGRTVVGATLTLSTGTWNDPQAAIAIAWQRCAADGSSCTTIDGATAPTYVLTDNDAGASIQAVVTATNAGGSTTATATAGSTITGAPAPPVPPAPPVLPEAPAVSTPPSIGGDTVVGATLTLSTGTWSDPQAAIAIAWQRCAADGSSCTTIDGATAPTYVLTDNDAGASIQAVVTATNAGGSTTATATAGSTITGAPAPPAPADGDNATVTPVATESGP